MSSLFSCDAYGQTPVYRALSSNGTDIAALARLLPQHAESEICSDSNGDVLQSCKKPVSANREALFQPLALSRVKTARLLLDSIEDPARHLEHEVSTVIGGNSITHRECCLLNTLLRMMNRAENQWRKLCRFKAFVFEYRLNI